jgi:hypothetical protein
MLQVLYARELQDALPKKATLRARRLQGARQMQAEKIAEASLLARRPLTADDVLRDCDDFARAYKLDERQRLLVGAWLLEGDPVPPFDSRHLPPGTEKAALVAALQRLGTQEARADEIVSHLMEGRRIAREALGEPPIKTPSRVLPAIALAAGATLLAGTGVGLAAAFPAGVYGGAAIITWLVAVGPGGIVGGVATTAALTSTSALLVGIGTAGGIRARRGQGQPDRNSPEELFGAALRLMDAVTAHSALTIHISDTHAAEALGLQSNRRFILDLLTRELSATACERERVSEIEPKGRVAQGLRAKEHVLRAGRNWFNGELDRSQAGTRIREANTVFARALEGT